MAQSTIYFKVQNDSSANFEESTSNLLQLFKGATGYVGNSETDPNFDYVGKGVWGIGVNVNDSGVYTVKKTTDAGGSYTVVGGLETVPILMKDMLMLAGGDMEGDINMASNKITGVSSVSFNDASGTIHGIAAKNLLDKTATEAVTGAWTHSGVNTFTGTLNVPEASDFQIAGTALSATLTANDLNLIKGLYSASLAGQKLMTTARGIGSVEKVVTNANQVLTLAMFGIIKVTTASANSEITLPIMKDYSAGGIFVILKMTTGTGIVTVIPDAYQAGFIMKTGLDAEITGDTITMDSSDTGSFKFVILMCTGIDDAIGRWAIISGSDAVLS